MHRLAFDSGVSIYRCTSGPAGRFGGAKGARRPVLEIRRDLAALRYAEEAKEAEEAEEAKGGAEVTWCWRKMGFG